MTALARLTLGAAGLTALVIGGTITLVPQGFYAGYGIGIGTGAAALSEIRAPGANLAALGALILLGAFRPGLARVSAALGSLVFLAFAAGRMVSLVLDGWPGTAIAGALAIELALGGLCLLAWRGLRRSPVPAGARPVLAR